MTRLLTCVLVTLLAAAPAAQPKPVGAFSPDGAPAWVTFGSLADWESDAVLASARARCLSTGFRWIVHVGYAESPVLPIGPHAERVKARFDAAGLSPCVVGMTIGEEWYEHWEAGSFARYGLPAGVAEADAVSIIHHWLGRQQRAAFAATGWPAIWVSSWVHTSRPVPDGTQYVALDAYRNDGETWAASVARRIADAEAATSLPLVLIPRWFRSTGPAQGRGWRQAPTAADMDAYAAVLRRPRWVAMWGFLWQSRPGADLVGLADMPDARVWVERSLGVRHE